MSSVKVASSCSTSGTRTMTHVIRLIINEERSLTLKVMKLGNLSR
jgi:hypothetical protein